jgi:hypothetical protein
VSNSNFLVLILVIGDSQADFTNDEILLTMRVTNPICILFPLSEGSVLTTGSGAVFSKQDLAPLELTRAVIGSEDHLQYLREIEAPQVDLDDMIVGLAEAKVAGNIDDFAISQSGRIACLADYVSSTSLHGLVAAGADAELFFLTQELSIRSELTVVTSIIEQCHAQLTFLLYGVPHEHPASLEAINVALSAVMHYLHRAGPPVLDQAKDFEPASVAIAVASELASNKEARECCYSFCSFLWSKLNPDEKRAAKPAPDARLEEAMEMLDEVMILVANHHNDRNLKSKIRGILLKFLMKYPELNFNLLLNEIEKCSDPMTLIPFITKTRIDIMKRSSSP